MAHRLSLGWLAKLGRRPGFWLIVAILVLITIPLYGETLEHPPFIARIFTALGLTRHSFERILYLAPIVWGGFLFGRRGAVVISLTAFALMLPQAILVSSTPRDDIFEAAAVFVLGNVVAFTVASLRAERERRAELEKAQRYLRISEERYRGLFDNAHDAILLQDLDGNILAANRSTAQLTGYSAEDLTKMNVSSFLSDEGLRLAGQVRRRLLANEPLEEPYEQQLTRRDGSVVYFDMMTSLVYDKGKPVAFQHIARDITEQKRLRENLRYYTHLATRAQEEERKRVSRELYDDTIQALAVLSRELDNLASRGEGLSEESSQRLEEMWEHTNRIMQDMRRLGREMRPSSLDHLGLVPALQWLATDVREKAGIATSFNVEGEARRLPEDVELVLFRIAEEALQNVRSHSEASTAEITVAFRKGSTSVTIADNGKGSYLPRTISDLVRDGKLGLMGMQERAASVGGTLVVNSQPGRGTTIAMEVPA